MDALALPSSDAISDALRSLSVQSSIFCTSELHAPWGFTVEGSGIAKFHLVLAGSCWLRLRGGDPLRLGHGDLVLLPAGEEHSVSNELEPPTSSLGELLATAAVGDDLTLRIGGEGPVTRLLCGGFTLSPDLPAPASALLPPVLQVDAASLALSQWLEPVLNSLAHQAAEGQPGTQAMQAKITEVFIAEALRTWLIDAEQAGLFTEALLTDQPVAQALDAIRHRLDEPWTLSRLAAHAGLSRTALATRFKALVGDSPMHYLRRVRLSRAAALLATTRLSHNEIAYLTGYATEAALAKAFKRERGETLGAHRATSRGAPELELIPAAGR